ncbi:MAG: hypothetical protein AB7O66_05300 [Limisphaerales bacterium]
MRLPILRRFALLGCLGWLALASQPPAVALETGLHYYAVVDLTRGDVVQRGKAGDNGIAFDQLILGPRRPYRLLLLQASTFRVAEQSLTTPESGSTFKIGAFTLQQSRAPDTDRDGLPDDGELIMGTDPRKADTDGDGIADGAEVRDGLDPLSGLAVRTGIIASVRTPGPAVDICAINNLAIVALRDRGVAVYNIFAGFDPVSITLVDTPGIASRVSCSGTLIGVADGEAGLAVIDVSDPPAASVSRQVPLGSPALSVATAGFLAFVGLENGEIAVVDMNTGDILVRRWLGAPVVDVTFGKDLIYALAGSAVNTLALTGPDLDILATTTSPASSVFPNRRLFVGGAHAIATRSDGYNVFSLSNPERPTLLAVGSSPSRGWRQMVMNGSGEGIAAVGPAPSLASPADISIYDLSDPSLIGPLITTLPTPGSATAVALFNGLAYCADYNSGIQVINYLPPDRGGVPPTIELVTSFPNQQAEEGKIFVASARVTDDVQVRNVEFHLDGRLALTDGDFPFEYRFIAPLITPGRDTFTLRARAFDTGGNTTWSDETVIRLVPDATPPRVNRISPADGSFVRDPGTVGIVFNEPMGPANLATNLTFRGAGPDGIFFNTDDILFPSLGLTFPTDIPGAFLALDSDLEPGRYRLDLSANAADLAGNRLGTDRSTVFIVYSLDDDDDGDCMPDTLEPEFGFDPTKADTDGNGVNDGDEDSDGDRLANCAELLITMTRLNVADSDGDGVPDGDEDSDSDGIPDREELVLGDDSFVTNPLLADSDGDGNDDGVEVALGLDPNNPTDAGRDVLIDGRTVSLTGNARLGNLTLLNGAVMTHPAYASRGLVGLALTVSNLVIDASSRIDVSGRGYPGGLTGYNAASQRGRTRGDVAGSTRRNGGSHGGLAGFGDAERIVNEPYGDPFEPVDLGSGGGSDSGPSGAGGGRIRITADTLQLEGQILANGGNGSRYGGGGSGGSIFVIARRASGTGSMEALGGFGGAQSGGGGGGRISLITSIVEGSQISQLSAAAGGGITQGGPGTVHVRRGAQPSELVIRGGGRETPLEAGNPGGIVILDGSTVSAVSLEANELQLRNGAVLTHPPATLESEFRLNLLVDSLVVEAGSRIDVTARGYAGGPTPGAWNGRTLGNVPGSSRRAGGSYGGLGSVGDTQDPVNFIYGDFRNPNEPGSGGGSDSGSAGAGGGLVRLTARTIQLEGEIRADGGNGSRYGGGGSGGGIWVQTTGITGNGTFAANGGVSGPQSGTGGGGRVAIHYATTDGQVLSHVEAFAGASGAAIGGPGTVYLSGPGNNTLLVVRGAGRETPLPPGNPASRVLLDGCTVSGTNLTATELRLVNGAVLTHPPASLTTEFRIVLNIDSLAIDAASRIDVSGRGYASGLSLGLGWNGRTLGNQPGSSRRTGGSYGGLGALGDTQDPVNTIYGDFRNPDEPGSGGGSDSGPAGAGGGLVRIAARSIALEGGILANGFNGSRYGGGGSGGGVWIQTTDITGNGRLHANGGSSGPQSGTGGGGRVAVHYATTDGQVLSHLEALPGAAGAAIGGPGTIYLSATGATPQLVIRGSGRETPLPEGNLALDLLLDAATTSVETLGVRDLSLTNGAALTHPATTPQRLARLEVTATRVFVDETSGIRLTGRGFPGALTPGNNLVTSITVGLAAGSGRRAGGSHGGLGGTGDAEGAATPVYGDYVSPNQPGAGGGSDSGIAGTGGGALRLVAGNLTLLGAIIADGAPGSRYGGGGAGGSVWITAETISGSGSISAQGGAGGAQSGSGGGGRVAIHYTNREGSVLDSITAISSADGHSRGAAGTIYLQGAGTPPELLVRGPGRESPLPTGLPNHHLTVEQATLSATRLAFGDLRLLQGAVLTHPPATRTNVDRLDISAARVAIDAVSRIDLTGRGYLGGLSVPLLGVRGQTLNHREGSFQRTGGSYGGLGGIGDLNLPATETYGAWNRPDEAGSGGGSDSNVAGSGGGLVTVAAEELVLDGLIVTDGGVGTRYGGGGSGGGIRLEVGTLRGTGTARANGGSGGPQSGSGGGGRIAIIATNVTAFDAGRVEARGGLGGLRQGSAGTVYLGHPSRPLGDLRVDARGTNFSAQPTRLWMSSGRNANTTTLLANLLTDPAADFVPGALVGLELNPDTAQSSPARTFTIIANDATTISTDPADGDMRTVAGDGKPYAARFAVSRFSLVGGAIAEFVDADQNRPDRQGILSADTLEIANSSVLTHPPASTTTVYGLDVRLTDQLVLDATSRIDVSGRGYRGAGSSDNPLGTGRTLDNAAGSPRRVGGSHGGTGGLGDVGGAPATAYGDADSPATLGGGGGSDSGPAGDGGGRVSIATVRAQVAGSILASGGGGTRYGGGGAGGAILIVTDEWSGAGIVRADGGNGGAQSGGGGGGRIALKYKTQTLPEPTLSAPGGTGVNAGTDGTVRRQVIP